MAYVSRSRRSMVLALLASMAATSLLGACGQTPKLFARNTPPADVKMSKAEAVNATSQWARAYLRNPQDPKMALGYARSLKAMGANDQSLEVLKAAYRGNPNNGEVAAELGRVALEMNRVDIAGPALQSAQEQGIDDWKTLSAQGTLCAKKGEHKAAQEYFLAALKKKPDSAAVINNLALSYALDGKAKKSEELLRKAMASGQGDKRIRQNLAMVLGLQGKFSEARKVASVDMPEAQAKSNVAYLRDMVPSPKQVASATPKSESVADWSPFGSNTPVKEEASVQRATDLHARPTVATVKPIETESPAVAGAKPIQLARTESPNTAAKAQTVSPVNTTVAPKLVKVSGAESNASPGAPTQITPARLP